MFVTLKPAEERPTDTDGSRRSCRRSTQKYAGIQEAFVAIFPPPPVQGLGTVGGLQAVRRGPRRRRLRGAVRAGAGRHRRGLHETRADRALLELPGQRAADRRARRSRARQDLRRGAHRRLRHAAGLSRVALRERLQPLRPDLSGQRAGRIRVPSAAGTDPPAADAQRERRDGAARIARHRRAGLRPRAGDALQRLPRRRDQRRTGTGLQLRPGAGRDRAGARRAPARRHDVRVDRAGVPGSDRRQHDAPHLPALRAARLRGAGRAVRELVAAAQRDPDRADDAVLGDCRRLADGRRQQRVHADQLSRAGRAGVQERDPDRGVRQAAGAGGARAACRRFSMPAASGCARC